MDEMNIIIPPRTRSVLHQVYSAPCSHVPVQPISANAGLGYVKPYLDQNFLEAIVHVLFVKLVAVELKAFNEFLYRAF